jgi:lipopolysaccharide export system protein LptC
VTQADRAPSGRGATGTVGSNRVSAEHALTTSGPSPAPAPTGPPSLGSMLENLRALVGPRRRWLPTALLVVAALLTTWIVHRFDGATPGRPPEREEDPDYFLENFTTTTTGDLGTVRRRLSAERLLHFPDTDTNELTRPRLELHHGERTPWHIESERGWLSASGEVLLLLGPVHAWRDDEDGARLVDIHTRDVRILPNSEYGETDKPVVIRSRGSETRGIGMRAYLQESRVELLSRVTAIYQRDRD